MKKVIEWGKLTWPEAEKAVRQMPACILPLGAIEAHGPHMTLDVDNGICTEQSRRICEETGIILLPTIPMGQVWSLYRFPGTLTLSYYTLIAVVRDMLRSLYDHGFRVIFIRSHHYGNIPAVKQAVRESYEEFMGKDVKFVILEERGAMRSVAEQIRTSPCAHPVFQHACEVETSQALECCPECVDMERAICDYPQFTEDFDSTPTYWDMVTDTGVMGDATAATKEKGAALIAAEVSAMVQKVNYVLGEYWRSHRSEEDKI